MRTTKTVVDSGTWAASSDVTIDLPNSGAITRIDLEVSLTVTGVLAADTNTEYCQWKPIQSLTIESGGRTFLGMRGEQMGRMLHFLNRRDFPGQIFNLAMGTNTVFANYTIHFGSFPRNPMTLVDDPFDLSAFIPAKNETNLKLIWGTTQAADVADTAIDISAGTMRATVHEVLGLPSMAGIHPASSTESFPTLGSANTEKQFDVPGGKFLRRIAILCQDATAIASGGPLLANDIIDKITLYLPKESQKLIDVRYDTLLLHGGIPDVPPQTAAGAVTKPNDLVVDGFVVLDLRPYAADPVYGLDLTDYQTGDVKLELDIPSGTSGDDIIIWYDCVQRSR